MPLYNFDPAEEEGDWESELLEEEKDQHVALHIGVGIMVGISIFLSFLACTL